MFCTFCNGLSISSLIQLAESEFSGDDFPQEAYYRHHTTYTDLIESAKNGCELCKVIHRAFTETVVEGGYWDEYTLYDAVQGIESEGLSTDLKISISTKQAWGSEGLDRVKLFDTILVQAGKSQTYSHEFDDTESSPDWSSSDPLTPLSLEISVPRGKSRLVRNIEVGRYQTDPDLGSSLNHEIAKGWLDDCCAKLGEATQSVELPTRVIDVGNEREYPKIFISQMIEGKYVALSHCWGGVISPLLTIENLESLQKSVPFCDLPANFRDAISITRQLGIQYLWIDSLCIVQNSRLDWEIESKNMGSIYRHALLTISASTSPGSTHGILKSNPSSNESGNKCTLKIYNNGNLNDMVCISGRSKSQENLYNLFTECALSGRGWTLQEGLLSPRILYYGERQIYWKCPHGFQSADGVPSVDGGAIMPSSEFTFPRITSILHQNLRAQSGISLPTTSMILEDYYWLVETYSKCKLTFESDKLPAFSGIAEFLHQSIGGEYFAGLWSKDLAQGLSWSEETGACQHVKSYRAPSWSWAVTDSSVVFCPFIEDSIFLDSYEVQMVSWNVALKTESVYGQIESAQLIVKGWTKEMIRSSQEINAVFEDSAAFVKYDEPGGKLGSYDSASVFNVTVENGDFFLSTIDGKGPKKPVEEVEIDNDMFSKSEHIIMITRATLEDEVVDLVGLVLIKCDGVDTQYERVGFISFRTMPLKEFESWVAGWTQQTITLV